MSEDMSIAHTPLTIIVAATTKNGIGKNNALPWPMLKKEMAYFARITKRVPKDLDGNRRNVVIMGRKTWDSIPPKFRPLKDRTNIVISSQSRFAFGDIPEEVVVASDVRSSLYKLSSLVNDGKIPQVGRAFVIGGTSIYRKALDMPQTSHILLTRIFKEYDCDTFFPVDLEADGSTGSRWHRRSKEDLESFVEEEVSDEKITETSGDEAVQFEFQLYERV